ncbi:hypothetical protein DTO166G4_8050 [Paecilomyces variotii]|nr:hypothetical protein DTO164E3_9121 [Paecilomyces variotii]KAJ9192446.1 hypothetical protein DTO032I3_8288 [Paecilomyces variotii]KAJ9210334.1 hypothetical protein DTO166G4_8050 [Paecilomyces variotii]KAJ9237093.1 hypothetical protein DTO166G5_3778 [Paecilomyces variotii]KAJ9251154.1 hypothetical protein DTO195F2_7929 [Paecilomyces variotii]
MADSQPVFSPACPIPFILQPAERIQQLKYSLQTEWGQVQRVNVEALIKLYESGELGPRQLGDAPVYLVNGKRVEKNPWEDESVAPGEIKWCENMYHQFTQQRGPQPQQMVQSVSDSFAYNPTFNMHQVHARIRLPPQYGGDPRLTRPFLTPEPLIFVDMQILTPAFVELTPWFRETAVVKPDTPGVARLSGAAIRNHLFFATAPGNARLYVAQKKAGIIRDLPA